MQSVLHRPTARVCAVACLYLGVLGAVSLGAAPQSPAATANALPPDATGRQIYEAGCTACHGADGTGAPKSVVGFDRPLPDFTDCAFATAEADADWFAVVHEGGRIRGLGRQMPAFGDALSTVDITRVLEYVRTFCTDRAWPRGDLNFPRSFFTEKAFPENEMVWTTQFRTDAAEATTTALVYERRFGSRVQLELKAPFEIQPDSTGHPVHGLGDVGIGLKRALYANIQRGSMMSAGLEFVLPTGDESRGLGNGFTVFEPFVSWGQILPHNAFLQLHAGAELPSDTSRGDREGFVRTAIGATVAQEHGYGRAWSPQIEVLWAKPSGGGAEMDLVPQVQVSLSKLQHVLVAAGVRVPLTERDERHLQLLTYFLWDWFDGSLFDFWR
jgi:mono/diheme cytochrome c family protein